MCNDIKIVTLGSEKQAKVSPKILKRNCDNTYFVYYFCDSRNIIETSRCELFFSELLVVILKNSDILFSSDYKREN